jgi:hypothetical protein
MASAKGSDLTGEPRAPDAPRRRSLCGGGGRGAEPAPYALRNAVSTTSLGQTIGSTLVVSLAAALLVQRDALTSVWCFFAAVLSVLVLVAVGRQEQVGAPLREPLARTR